MNKTLMLVVGCVFGLAFVDKTHAQVAYVTYYSPTPACAAPAAVPVTTYYAPAPVVGYQPVPVAYTRYRPLLGGTVTRYRTAYAPVVVAPTPVVYGY